MGKFGIESRGKSGAKSGRAAASSSKIGGEATASCKRPTHVLDLQEKRIKMAAAGANHSLFLTDLGHVYSAGFNEFGQLGYPSEEYNVDKENAQIIRKHQDHVNNLLHVKRNATPVRISTLSNIRFIACGDHHSLAICDTNVGDTKESSLYSWGWGSHG